MDVTLKTRINTRAPLHERVPINATKLNLASSLDAMTLSQESNYEENKQTTMTAAAAAQEKFETVQINSFAMPSHCVPVTTYDHDYYPKTSTVNNNNNLICMKNINNNNKKEEEEDDDGSNNNSNNVNILDSVHTNEMQTSTHDTPNERNSTNTNVVITHYPSSEWQSESHAASRVVQPIQCLDFYARARRVEQVDDDKRGARVGNVQRSLEIRNKRATEPALRPPEAAYERAAPSSLSELVARDKFGVAVNYLDLVQCKHRSAHSEYGFGFHHTPVERLEQESPYILYDIPTQRKALTRMSTSHELFAGTAKSTCRLPPGYGGYVPHAAANRNAMLNNTPDIDYAVASFVINSNSNNNNKYDNSNNSINATVTTIDSQQQSAEKCSDTVTITEDSAVNCAQQTIKSLTPMASTTTISNKLPRHMGITMTDLNDPRRNYSKANMTLAVHGGGIDPSLAQNALRSRHRTGKYARAPQMLKPKNAESINKMVEGSMLQCTLRNVTAEEQAINVRDDKRGNAYF